MPSGPRVAAAPKRLRSASPSCAGARSIDGTHHHVSSEHLHRYLGEFDFRHSTRKMTDSARMEVMVGRVAGGASPTSR